MQIFWDFRDVFFYLCFLYLFLTSDVYLSLHPFSLQREMSEVEIKITQEKDVTKNKRKSKDKTIPSEFSSATFSYLIFRVVTSSCILLSFIFFICKIRKKNPETYDSRLSFLFFPHIFVSRKISIENVCRKNRIKDNRVISFPSF